LISASASALSLRNITSLISDSPTAFSALPPFPSLTFLFLGHRLNSQAFFPIAPFTSSENRGMTAAF